MPVPAARRRFAEFPQNERLLITLADTLSEAGWRRHHEWVYYDEEGYIQHGYDKHKSNAYWTEAVKICERLLETTHDNAICTRAVHILVLLYRNFGETEKALACAARMPALRDCRELLRASAADGKAEAEYVGEALLEMASAFSSQLVYGLICNRQHYETDMPIEKVKGAIALFSLLCDDGNLGPYHGKVIQLYLYLSRLQWERGYQAEAFASLDESACARESARSAVRRAGAPSDGAAGPASCATKALPRSASPRSFRRTGPSGAIPTRRRRRRKCSATRGGQTGSDARRTTCQKIPQTNVCGIFCGRTPEAVSPR